MSMSTAPGRVAGDRTLACGYGAVEAWAACPEGCQEAFGFLQDGRGERCVSEVGDIPVDISLKLGSEQVWRYQGAYGLVLVANYRAVVLLGRDARGQPERRDSFSFGGADADAVFALARSPGRPAAMAARFAEFLERTLLPRASLARPEDVAFFLASYARDALARADEQASPRFLRKPIL